MHNRLAQHPADAIALIDRHGVMTYGVLREEVARISTLLRQFHNDLGGTVAIALPDSAAWVVADIACLVAGIPSVPVPAFFTAEQRAHVLAHAGITFVIGEKKESGETITLAGISCTITRTGQKPVALPQGTAKITYTSGTTGAPKGVCLSADAMIQQADVLHTVLGNEYIHTHRCLLPLAVLLENVAGVYVALRAGATVHLGMVAPTPAALAKALIESKASSCILVPALLESLVASREEFPDLRYAAVGGAFVPPTLIEQARAQAIPVYEGYGLSEACSVVALNTPRHDKPGTCGKPLRHPGLYLAEDGEIMLRHPRFLGYLGEAPPTLPLATGDLGVLDTEGFLRVSGRKKNIIITAYGRNFSPEWAEAELCAGGAIAQAVVFGDGKPFNSAVIVTRDPEAARLDWQHANARLPDYAQIKHLIFAETPFSLERGEMTATGKPNRSVIYRHYAASIEALYERNVA